MINRALRRRCPRCGRGRFFDSWATVARHCESCGLTFERESGYWVGAMIVGTAVTFGMMLLVFVGAWVLLWPDVPWNGVMIGTVAIAVVTPIVFHPWSKSLWAAIELSYHQLEPGEASAAAARIGESND